MKELWVELESGPSVTQRRTFKGNFVAVLYDELESEAERLPLVVENNPPRGLPPVAEQPNVCHLL